MRPRQKGRVGVNDGEDPPVPIPNTVVKLTGAEDTWLEAARENRAMPTPFFFKERSSDRSFALQFFYGDIFVCFVRDDFCAIYF